MLSVGFAYIAGSVALLGFGVDSFVEGISNTILIWRLRAEQRGQTADEEAIEHVERRAERMVGVSFFLLALYVAVGQYAR